VRQLTIFGNGEYKLDMTSGINGCPAITAIASSVLMEGKIKS